MITILKPGLLTTIQDLGRYGFQKNGIIASGAMDPIAHRIANILVGNAENDPTLEITLLGPTIQFHHDTLIAICGADLSAKINGEIVKLWRPILLKKGAILKFTSCKTGCRTYLALAGSFKIPAIMNSCSTYLRAKIGGYKGRAIKAGDQLHLGPKTNLSSRILTSFIKKNHTNEIVEAKWTISPFFISNYSYEMKIRVMKGRQYHLFNRYSQTKFFSEPYKITPQSDRMGYRLSGPTLALIQEEEIISEAVTYGTIQVPGDGQPIILLADRQTTGGYPKIAQIAMVDLPLIAQAKPGDYISFIEITQSEAQLLFLKREEKIQRLKTGIAWKYK